MDDDLSKHIPIVSQEEKKNKQKYDPYTIPADLDYAEDHLKATKIAKPIISDGTQNIDDATGLPVDNVPLSLCSSLDELNFMSPGYPMYFQFLKFCIYICFVMFMCSGLYGLTSNYQGTDCFAADDIPTNVTNQWYTDNCIKGYILSYSLANKRNDQFAIQKQMIYNLFTIIICALLLQFLRKIQKETAIIIDERDTTAADFTVRAKGIPKKIFEDENDDIQRIIKEWFTSKGIPGKILDVQNVSVCYNCTELLEVEKELTQSTAELKKLEAKKAKGEEVDESQIQNMQTIIDRDREVLRDLNERFIQHKGVAKKFAGEAYITLNTMQEVKDTLNFWKISKWQRFKERNFNSDSHYKWKNKLVTVKKATEPSDVKWGNAGISNNVKRVRRFITIIGTMLVISLSFIIIGVFNILKKNAVENVKQGEDYTQHEIDAIVTLISFISSCLIIVINFLLRATVERFSEFEKHATETDLLRNYSEKLAFAQFFNTAMIYMLVSWYLGNYFGSGGLVTAVWQIHLFNAALPLVYGIIDSPYIKKAFARKKVRDHTGPILMTQKELNDIFEDPKFPFAQRYAGYVKTVCSAALFTSIVPMAMLFSLISLFFSYWMDKVIMFKKRSRGVAYGPEFPMEFIEFLEYPMILFSLGNIYFMWAIADFGDDPTNYALSIFGATIGILNALLPMDSINTWLFPVQNEKLTDEKYSEIRLKLIEDYDRFNPATRELALKKFREEREGIDNADEPQL